MMICTCVVVTLRAVRLRPVWSANQTAGTQNITTVSAACDTTVIYSYNRVSYCQQPITLTQQPHKIQFYFFYAIIKNFATLATLTSILMQNVQLLRFFVARGVTGVKYKQFWSGTNNFGHVQIRLLWTNFYNLDLSKMIWTQPKCIEPVQKQLVVNINNLDQSKTIATRPK